MFPQKGTKKRLRTKQFRCEVSVLANKKVCHTVNVFSRYAHNLQDFLFLIHYNMEKELNRKLLWTDIFAKKIELFEFGSWNVVVPNEEDIASIKIRKPH